jgi:hypothetical protein
MRTLFILAALLAFCTLPARAECYGSGEYQICSDSYTDSGGDVHSYTYDSEGNDYSIDTNSYSVGDEHVTTTTDSDGNSYSIRSWVDSDGAAHTRDSTGRECTIYPDGSSAGC